MNAFENPELVASDARLLRQWVEDRDAEAFREIVTRHVHMVFGACKRVSGNTADAEDAVQECFLKLATSDIRVRASLAGWLHRVATRAALSRMRSDRRRARREKTYARESPPRDDVPWMEIERHVDEAIEDLSEKVRHVVIRHYLEGESQAAIARDLRISPAAVSSRLCSGVERIRKHLKRRGLCVPAAALAAMLRARCVEAASPALSVALAKLALSGIMMPAGGGGLTAMVTSTGALLMMKKVILVSGVAVLGFTGVLVITSSMEEDPSASVTRLDVDPAVGVFHQETRTPPAESPPIRVPPDETPALSVRLVDDEDRAVSRGRAQIRWGRWDDETDPEEPAERRFAARTGWERLAETANGLFVDHERRGEVANLTAGAPGFLPGEEWVEVGASGLDDVVTVRLDRGPVLRGRVVDALRDDEPISEARVGFHEARSPPGPFESPTGTVELFHEVVTDADGRFEISGVLGAVSVIKEPFGTTVVDVEYGWDEREYRIPMYPPTRVRLRVFDEERPVEAFEYGLAPFQSSWPADWRGTSVEGFETELQLLTRCLVGGGSSSMVSEYLGIGARVDDAFTNKKVRIPPGTDAQVDVHFGSRSTAVTGIVLDGAANPVAGTRVTVGAPATPIYYRSEHLEGGARTVITALDGTFIVPVQPGPAFVAALHPDHAVYVSEQLLVPDGHRVRHTIRLPEPASVLGTIADGVAHRDGRRLRLAPASGAGGPEFALGGFSRETNSDAAGSFRFDDLPAGYFQVRLVAAEGETVDTTVEICTRPGKLCRTTIGRRAGADVVSVAGRVVSDGEPVEGANVLILGHGYSGSPFALSKSDASGSFVLDAAPSGRHRLKVYAESRGKRSKRSGLTGLRNVRRPARSRIVQIEVRPGMEPVEIDLSPVALDGRVVSTTGPVSGVKVFASSIALHAHAPVWMGGVSSLTDEEGYFRLEGLYQTPYRLYLKKEGYLIKTVDWKPVQLEAGPELEIAMERSAGEVRFRMFDGRRAAPFDGEVTAAVYPELQAGGASEASLIVAEGSGGSASVRGLPAGDYLARVYPTVDGAEGFAHEWIRFRRESGAEQDFEATLRPGGAIRVRIVTDDGVAPAWSSLELWTEDGTPIPPGWHNGLVEYFRGELLTPRLPVGKIRLRVASDGHEPRNLSVQVDPQSTASVQVDYGE